MSILNTSFGLVLVLCAFAALACSAGAVRDDQNRPLLESVTGSLPLRTASFSGSHSVIESSSHLDIQSNRRGMQVDAYTVAGHLERSLPLSHQRSYRGDKNRGGSSSLSGQLPHRDAESSLHGTRDQSATEDLPYYNLSGASLTFNLNDSLTNETFESLFCNTSFVNITGLVVQVAYQSQNWFRLPSCVSSFSKLASVSCTYCQLPNFTLLPPSVSYIGLQYARGSWSQLDAGTGELDDFDWEWLSRLPALRIIGFYASGIKGTLPNHLNHSGLFSLDLSGQTATFSNQFVGSIAPDFFVRYPQLAMVRLTFNQLTGTIPYYGLEKVTSLELANNQFTNWPTLSLNSTSGFGAPAGITTISLNNNQLVEIPSAASLQTMPALNHFSVASNPQLTGPFPNFFTTNPTRTSPVSYLSVANCNFSGTLPAIPSSLTSLFSGGLYLYYFENNNFEGTVPSSWYNTSFLWLSLSGNPGLGGSISKLDADGVLVSPFFKLAQSLFLDGPGFTGNIFNISIDTILQSTTMQLPNVDFCSAARSFAASTASRPILYPSSVSLCTLTDTNANQCAWAFPSVCTFDSLVPSVPTPTCPLPSPGSSFICVGTTWISTGSVTETTITVPASSTTTVNGNLTTTSIVITSISSTINVTGCITTSGGSTPEITVTLTQADLEEIVKNGGTLTTQLLHQASSCAALSSSSITIDTHSIKSCKTIKTDKIGDNNGLAATFTVNTSKCNVWWIILVSVLCGAALIAVIITVIAYNACIASKRQEQRNVLNPKREAALN